MTGSYGGTLLAASRHIGQTPLPRYVRRGPVHTNKCGTHMSGVHLQVRGGALQISGAYNRGGLDPTILVEFPKDPVVQDWARKFRPKVLKPSCGTCFAKGGASKIDFVILTDGLEAVMLEYVVVMEIPFSPRAAIKFSLEMDLDFFSARVFSTPRALPTPAK